jgi:hypothetical protein
MIKLHQLGLSLQDHPPPSIRRGRRYDVATGT